MAKQILNVGTTNNDKTGDTLRAGGLKIKANFDEIYTALATDGLNISGGNILKTGSYADLNNKPNFATIATSGSFDDLLDKPALVTATATPESLVGFEGQSAGQIAFDANNLYVSTAAYDGTTQIWKYIPWGGSGTSQGYRYTHNENPIETGGFSLDNSDPALATVAYVATTDISENDIHPFYQYVTDNSLNANLEIISATNPQNRALFHITGITEMVASGIEYYELQLTYIMHSAGMTVGTGVWDLHFDFTGTAGNANTGDITFDGVKVIGDGTASGDGNGYSTLELVPDNSLYSNHQYLVIDPTAPSHIHIRAGGSQDDSNAELYFGGERTNVRIADYSGVRLTRINNNFLNNYNYASPVDFTLGEWITESGNHYIQYTTANPTLANHIYDLNANIDNYVTVFYNSGNNSTNLKYGGSSQDMGGGIYRVQVDTAPIGGSPITIENMFWEFYQEQNNYAEITSDFTVNVADDVRITGRDIFNLRNRSVDEPIQIRTDYDNLDHTWSFNADGNLQLPHGKRVNWGQNATTLAAPVAGGLNDRLTLWDFQGSGTDFNYAIGVEGNHIWFTMDVNNKTGGFKFYSRDDEIFKIRDDGSLIFRNTNKFNVVNVPTSSLGAIGDEQGSVAFDEDYMYYCTSDFVDGSYSTVLSADTTNDTKFTFAKGVGIAQPQVGWNLTILGLNVTNSITLVEDLGTDWRVTWSGGNTGVSTGTGITITPVGTNNIWKRVAWSNDTW